MSCKGVLRTHDDGGDDDDGDDDGDDDDDDNDDDDDDDDDDDGDDECYDGADAIDVGLFWMNNQLINY